VVPFYLDRADKFAREEAPQISAMLVARHGYIVFERYYGDYGPASYFSVNSVTKSVCWSPSMSRSSRSFRTPI
jgi:hypothetical protein